jgi:methylated-DNA-[protein]-cysteine S-methyltransferase
MEVGKLKIYLASTTRGIARIGLGLGTQKDCLLFFRNLLPDAILVRSESFNHPHREMIEALLENRKPRQPLDLDITCTPFENLIYRTISKIPFGETRTYGKIASMAGHPKSARAVGRALGANPVPLIFP